MRTFRTDLFGETFSVVSPTGEPELAVNEMIAGSSIQSQAVGVKPWGLAKSSRDAEIFSTYFSPFWKSLLASACATCDIIGHV
jgi:hypothetical protein